jgi:hypothetical protein
VKREDVESYFARRRGGLSGLRLEDVDLKDRLAYVTGKGGHNRAAKFGARTAVALDRDLRQRTAAGLSRLQAHQFRHAFAHRTADTPPILRARRPRGKGA